MWKFLLLWQHCFTTRSCAVLFWCHWLLLQCVLTVPRWPTCWHVRNRWMWNISMVLSSILCERCSLQIQMLSSSPSVDLTCGGIESLVEKRKIQKGGAGCHLALQWTASHYLSLMKLQTVSVKDDSIWMVFVVLF